MYSIVSTPSKMRRQGFVDGIACAAAFFHRGLCPLCGGGFRRCRSESRRFTPAEEGGRCHPACRLRHGLGKSYRKAFTESHISTQKSGRISCRFSLSIRTTPRAQIPGIISLCARGTASRLSLGPAGGDSLAPLAGSSSLAILGTERVCNRFYTLLRLLVCADPGHAPKYAKKRRYETAAFRFLSEPLRGHKSRASFPTVRANCVRTQSG